MAALQVPPALFERDLVITAIDGARFSVFEPTSNSLFYGKVGALLRADTPAGQIELQVARLEGRPGARFLARRSSVMAGIKRLQRELIIAEKGKLSGVIEVRLEGADALRGQRGAARNRPASTSPRTARARARKRKNRWPSSTSSCPS